MKRHFGMTAKILVGLGIAFVVALVIVSFVVEEPLRRWIEREINAPLDGYTVRIGGLDLHPLTASVELEQLLVSQDKFPNPPIVEVPRTDGRLDLRALLSGAMVVSIRVERPIVNVNLAQLREEARDSKPIADKGWQEAINNVNPLKINRLRVIGGEVTYLEDPKSDPIHLEQVDLVVENIRNVRSESGTYPSPIRLDARVFGEADLAVEGAADFLATPRPTGRVAFKLAGAPVGALTPATKLVGVTIRDGTVDASGTAESGATETHIHLGLLRLDGIEADYVETKTPTPEKKATKTATKAATKAATSSASETQVRVVIDSLEVRASDFGFVNATVEPRYRVSVDVVTASLRQFSNGEQRENAPFVIDGQVMNSGTLRLQGSIRPGRDGPDLELDLKLEDMEVKTLNDLLRAHGRLDVVAGRLSVFSEVTLQDRRVKGYVKPLIEGLEVSDPAQDRDKPVLNRIYQGAVDAVAKLLENQKTDQVATVTPIEGSIDAIDADGWRSIVLLLRNAFVEAIRAGLEGDGGK